MILFNSLVQRTVRLRRPAADALGRYTDRCRMMR